jgi:YD repeat-containing protein
MHVAAWLHGVAGAELSDSLRDFDRVMVMTRWKRWRTDARALLSVSCVLTGTLACADPAPEDSGGPTSPPSLHGRQWDSSVIIDGSYPDRPPSTFIVITASGVGGPLSFSADAVELFGPDGGEPLATIHGALEPKTPSYANGYTGPAYFTGTDLNRDLLAACDATSYRISVWTSGCRCETVVEGPVRVSCYPDLRSEDLLAEPGFDAPSGKPCGMTRVILVGDDDMEEHRYRYQADGRLRFIDIYDQGTLHAERVAFVWDPSGFLGERQTIDPVTTVMTSRKKYTYGPDGLLSTTEIDGWGTGRLDGYPDNASSYFLAEAPWRVENTEIRSGQFSQRSFFHSSVDNIITSDGQMIELGAPLESPNQVFALPEEVDTLKILRTSATEYTYDADGRLLYTTTPIVEGREDYAYDCP